jgi:hypothetical protein
MDNKDDKIYKRFFITAIFVLILIAAAGLILIWKSGISFLKEKEVSKNQPVKNIAVKSFPKGELPSGLPSDIPLEKDAQVLRNEKVTIGNETTFRRVFVSDRSLEENKKIYLEYLNKNGWEAADSRSPEGFAVLIGNKSENNQRLRIVISKLKAPAGAEIALTGSEVDITLTEVAAKE